MGITVILACVPSIVIKVGITYSSDWIKTSALIAESSWSSSIILNIVFSHLLVHGNLLIFLIKEHITFIKRNPCRIILVSCVLVKFVKLSTSKGSKAGHQIKSIESFCRFELRIDNLIKVSLRKLTNSIIVNSISEIPLRNEDSSVNALNFIIERKISAFLSCWELDVVCGNFLSTFLKCCLWFKCFKFSGSPSHLVNE